MKSIILEYDDFHPKEPENCLREIYKLIEEVPDIKISLFTTPIHSGYCMSSSPQWCDEVRELIKAGNLRLAAHGMFHTSEEFKHISEEECMLKLARIEQEFFVSNLPFAKVFRGPHWGINRASYNQLIAAGYSHIYTHEDYRALSDPRIKSVFYNWNLKDPQPPEGDDIIVAHGHTHNVCGNGIQETLSKVVEFCRTQKPSFKFVDEY